MAAAAPAPGKPIEAIRRPAEQRGELLLDRTIAAVRRPSRRPGYPSARARLLRSVDRFPGRYLAGLAEVLLVGSIGFQCAALFGVGIMTVEPPPPRSLDRALQLPPSTVLLGYNSFFGMDEGGGALPVPTTGLELHGIRQDGRTGQGSAIISEADGPQRSFGVGEAISPGLVLMKVGPGYATVARNGVEERLAFAAFDATGARARVPDMTGASARPVTAPSPRAPGWPSAPATAGPPKAGSSINFADPSTLPASLNPPAAAAAGPAAATGKDR